MPRMTENEYYDKLREILKPFDCVSHIRDFISSYAYEHGHSCGYEEIIIHATNIAYDLKEALIEDKIIKVEYNPLKYIKT